MWQVIGGVLLFLLGGGLAVPLVTWWNGRQDREKVGVPQVDLAQRTFEYQKSKDQVTAQKAAYHELNEAFSDVFDYLNSDFQTDGPVQIQAAQAKYIGQLSRVMGKLDVDLDSTTMYFAREAGKTIQEAMRVAFEGDDPEYVVELASRGVQAVNFFAKRAIEKSQTT